MSTYTAGNLVDLLGQQLHDVGQDIWSESLLLSYLSEAQNQIASLRPDATGVTGPFVLAQSAKQEIPAGGVRFIDCVRNLGIDGAVPGRHIKKISRNEIDGYYPTWTSDESATEVKRYIFDPTTPKVFWVYPTPSIGTLNVELSYSKAPVQLTVTTDSIGVDDIYISPLLEWVMYRCMSMEAEGANASVAQAHMQTFYNALRAKISTDTKIAEIER
ncbi:MAG: hypothetical protein HON48_14310 [Desulfobacula sp.]|jgi:hypothetical protein|nr:hypothetical protein [Desulfobacula sp.]